MSENVDDENKSNGSFVSNVYFDSEVDRIP